ncbi:hypothetical protein Tco_0949208 [Tanacetum coccineum]
MVEPVMNEARAERNLAEPSIESNVKYKLGEELLKELHSNPYSGRVEEDLVGHITKILEILNPIEVTDKMCEDGEEGLDPLEFITWRNSKFKEHKKVDETTKRAFLYSWIEVGNNEGLIDEDISRDDDRDQTNSSMITKPEIKIGDEFLKMLHDNSFNGMDESEVTDHIAKDGKDIYEIIDSDYSPIPTPDRHDISNPDELCQTEEFTVVRTLLYGKLTIWYTLKKTCVELVRSILKPRQHTFAQRTQIGESSRATYQGSSPF